MQELVLGYVAIDETAKDLPRVCCLTVDGNGHPVEFVYGDGKDPGGFTRALWGKALTSELQVKAAGVAMTNLERKPDYFLLRSDKLWRSVRGSGTIPCLLVLDGGDTTEMTDFQVELGSGYRLVGFGKGVDKKLDQLKKSLDADGVDIWEPFSRIEEACEAIPETGE